MVGIQVGFLWYEIGTASFLTSWFSTVNYHLENKKWGRKYPIIMNDFYQGRVPYSLVKQLKKEVLETKEKLKKYKPSQVIWDIDDLSKTPPWGDNISNSITSLADYYITCDGKDFYEVLLRAIDKSLEYSDDILIEKM